MFASHATEDSLATREKSVTEQQCVREAKAIFQAIGEHSKEIARNKKSLAGPMARVGSLFVGAGLICLLAAFLLSLSAKDSFASGWVRLVLSSVPLAILTLLVGLMLRLADSVRMAKRPLADRLDSVVEGLGADTKLLMCLATYDEYSLEFVRRRMRVQSQKIRSALQLPISGSGLTVAFCLVGFALILYALVTQFFGVVTVAGISVLLALTIGGWMAKSGAGQAEFYVELIEFAIHTKQRGRALVPDTTE